MRHTPFLVAAGVIVMLAGIASVRSGHPRQAGTPHPYDHQGPLSLPQLFAPGILNTSADEYGPTISPDGRMFVFTRRNNRRGPAPGLGREFIVSSQWNGTTWSNPVIVPFSGTHQDKEPFLSPDGRRLFFARLESADPEAENGFDIWVVDRTPESWSQPVKLGAEVNSDSYDNYPSVAANGNLYFGSRRAGGSGGLDLYRSRLDGSRYLPAENLGSIVNSAAADADPYIAPDESYLIFSSTRGGGMGQGDLYLSLRSGNEWTAPRPLTAVNTPAYEYTPFVSPNGKYLFFSRDFGEMYQIDRSAAGVPAASGVR